MNWSEINTLPTCFDYDPSVYLVFRKTNLVTKTKSNNILRVKSPCILMINLLHFKGFFYKLYINKQYTVYMGI